MIFCSFWLHGPDSTIGGMDEATSYGSGIALYPDDLQEDPTLPERYTEDGQPEPEVAASVDAQNHADSANPPELGEEDFFDSAPICQHIVAPDGTVLRANRTELELLGYAESEFVGHSIVEFHTDPALFAANLSDLFRGEQLHHREIQLRCKDGSVKSLLVSGRAFMKDGVWAEAHCFLRDITEHKLAEEKLHEINRNKDEFLATLAHELRNPLAPIRSAVEILNLQKPSSDMQWALDVIDRQMRQMSRLIDDLLDIARITGNKLELHIERVELAEAMRVAIETSRPLIEASGQRFYVTHPPEPIYLSGDLIRLAQVISNLLNNASKYTPPEGSIWVTALRQGDQAVITVKDNGVGIAPAILPRIFDLFTQGYPTKPARRGGLGIGLTLVKRLVEMHGGAITAESSGPDEGSMFTVRLPIVTNLSQRLYRPVYDRERAASGSSLRILVVDDNIDAAATLERMLTMAGNTVSVAHDGVAALSVAAEFLPEVILLDLDLPKMNGYEVAKAVRDMPGGSEMVIIAVTGFGLPSDKVRSKEAGFNHHLVKPVDPASLLQLLTSIERYGGKLPEHIFQTA